jgi:hypothetical protein
MRMTYPELESRQPARIEDIVDAEQAIGPIPRDLRAIYQTTNGLRCRSFSLFPVFEASDPKATWESVQRANDPSTTGALGGNQALLAKFVVFADIGNGFAAMDRIDGTIWFEESGSPDLTQTDFTVMAFIETMIANAS